MLKTVAQGGIAIMEATINMGMEAIRCAALEANIKMSMEANLQNGKERFTQWFTAM